METVTDAPFRWTLRPVPDEARVAAVDDSRLSLDGVSWNSSGFDDQRP